MREILLIGSSKCYFFLRSLAQALSRSLKSSERWVSGRLRKQLPVLIRKKLLSGERSDAIRLVDRANVRVLQELGNDFLDEGNRELSLFCRQAAVALCPENQDVRRELLRTLFYLGKQKEALSQATDLDLSFPSVPRHDLTPEEKVIYSVVCNLAIASPELVANLVRATDHVLHGNIPGAFVECGVFRGGSAMVMMMALLNRECRDREFYLYDTFAGMPKPEDVDVYVADGKPALEEWEEKKSSDGSSGWVVSTLEQTRTLVESVGYPKANVQYVQGLVEDTIPAVAPEKIALLRLDTDFYRSTKHELEHLFPRLSPGGALIIDDYGAFHGAQIAVDEYFREKGMRPFLHRVDSNVRIFFKPL